MEHIFGNMKDKLKAVTELKSIGIDNDQALDIVFESIQENENVQFMQHVFKIAFMYGQVHESSKNSQKYTTTDAEAISICVNECTKIIKS
jgi:hypothetical protein